MTDFLLFVVSVIGMTHIIVDSDMPLVAWLREYSKKLLAKIPPKDHWQEILSCYQCCGTWCGFFAGTVLITYNIFGIFLCGCAGGFLAKLGGFYLDYLQAQTIINLDTEPQTKEKEDDNGRETVQTLL